MQVFYACVPISGLLDALVRFIARYLKVNIDSHIHIHVQLHIFGMKVGNIG